MRVLIAALADHASVSQPGEKLNVNGVFDTIGAAGFPTALAAAALAIRLQLDYEDRKAKHSLEVVIVNQDGKEFAKIGSGIEAPEIRPGARVVVNQLIFFQRLVFQAPDKFSIVIRWNGDEKQRLSLDVVAVQAPPTAR